MKKQKRNVQTKRQKKSAEKNKRVRAIRNAEYKDRPRLRYLAAVKNQREIIAQQGREVATATSTKQHPNTNI